MEAIPNFIDKQYAYAKKWFGFEDAAPIPTRMLFDRINGTMANSEYVALPGNDIIGAIHEVTHHLLFNKNIYADFYWFSEGIAMAIMYIYASEDPESYGAAMVKGADETFKQNAHMRAWYDVNYLKENDRYEPPARAFGVGIDEKPSATPQGFAKTYETAASFVLYLLDIGSKDDFMRLYVDTSAAEELYGKDFNALYEQWLEFIMEYN
jgi:hypothetical protein